jgi:LmbE family N-acetylglucosaminyl deacetylase
MAAATSLEFSSGVSPVSAAPSVALPPFVLTPKQLSQMLGRTLLLMPHSDDECNVGALLQHLSDATILFLTDSAPRDRRYWSRFGTRESYRELRRVESERALADLGVGALYLSDLTKQSAPADQELYRHLPSALHKARELVSKLAPKTLLAPAYEGGHPDHDTAAFLAAQVSREFRTQHWETPYYHRSRSGKLKRQTFLHNASATSEITLALSPAELARKQAMWQRYSSQSEVLSDFSIERELYRPAPFYDFTRPPHNGQLNYEAWQWETRGQELVESFRELSHAQLAVI